MDLDVISCPFCGSPVSEFNAKSCRFACSVCGKHGVASRAQVNRSDGVLHAMENALRFFCDNNLSSARKYAEDALNIAIDNVPALYIVAYCELTENKVDGRIKKFFDDVFAIDPQATEMGECVIVGEELEDFRKMILHSPYTLIDFEPQILQLFANNLPKNPTVKDSETLCTFIDTICPYFIVKRSSINFLTPQLVEYYKEYASFCTIPKTVYALYNAIKTNPESPFVTQSLALKQQNRLFFNEFVLPIGEIIDSMADPVQREKFSGAFAKLKAKLEAVI